MVNLLHGNALELIKDVPDKSIDLIFTDPPYNQNINRGEHWDNCFDPLPYKDDFIRVLKPNAPAFIFTGPMTFGIWVEMFKKHFYKVKYFVWIKPVNVNKLLLKNQFYNNTELILMFMQKNQYFKWLPRHYAESYIMRNYKLEYHCSKNEMITEEWAKGYRTKYHTRQVHPTQKPLKLVKYLIDIACPKDGMILDPFSGVATTGVAAIDLGMNATLFELDETYYKYGKMRIERYKPNLNIDFTEDEKQDMINESKYIDYGKQCDMRKSLTNKRGRRIFQKQNTNRLF